MHLLIKPPTPPDDLIPKQETGSSSDIQHSIVCASAQQAMELFETAKHRLLDVSHWHETCGKQFSGFHLCDAKGNQLDTLAKPGNYFNINIPGPGSSTGEGYDWVRIEHIKEASDPQTSRQWITMRVRPAAHPLHKQEGTAHFFTNRATSTFMVERTGNTLVAAVHGRNEHPNIQQVKSLPDKIRNTLVAAAAIAGLSGPQWQKLAEGILAE